MLPHIIFLFIAHPHFVSKAFLHVWLQAYDMCFILIFLMPALQDAPLGQPVIPLKALLLLCHPQRPGGRQLGQGKVRMGGKKNMRKKNAEESSRMQLCHLLIGLWWIASQKHAKKKTSDTHLVTSTKTSTYNN